MGKNVADRAIQVLGGYGYVGEYHVERLWRDAKLLEIGGGTLEAHQKNMTRELATPSGWPRLPNDLSRLKSLHCSTISPQSMETNHHGDGVGCASLRGHN